ncbi:hypothetical protein PCLA_04r0248 [Pseudomonas citronellolis]|nr:hypothetical protein PCLA_04r0248 [Pseudomonas citronellolis]
MGAAGQQGEQPQPRGEIAGGDHGGYSSWQPEAKKRHPARSPTGREPHGQTKTVEQGPTQRSGAAIPPAPENLRSLETALSFAGEKNARSKATRTLLPARANGQTQGWQYYFSYPVIIQPVREIFSSITAQ